MTANRESPIMTIRNCSTALAVSILVLASLAMAQTAPIKQGPILSRALADDPTVVTAADGTIAVWVRFANRGLDPTARETALERAARDLTERARGRRAKMQPTGSRLVDDRDLPLAASYVDGVLATGARERQRSRWLNALSVDATPEQIAAIAGLPFVREVELVARFTRRVPDVAAGDAARAAELGDRAADAARWNLDYGGSTAGLEQINVPPVHELGLTGDGVLIALLDAGFKRTHTALQGVDVVAEYDFVDDDDTVENEPGDPLNQDRHGTWVLSTIMGYAAGELIGPAFGASVILAKTEDVSDETEIEEDNWVAAIEWVESLGADIVSSSLGYYYWYEFSDLDGNTAVTTIAADHAVELGMGVFTSAGNERDNLDWGHLTAPADGDSVVAMAAVDLDGQIASFSSPGPTFDGRIKPDVAALGVGAFVASYYDDGSYQYTNGTSFAAPLVAGVAALLLERVPQLTPLEVREAIRETASRADAPDNDYGWGVVDALAAIQYWGPAITHTPLSDTEDTTGPYLVTATITDRVGLETGSLVVAWRLDGGAWSQTPLVAAGGDEYVAEIPGQTGGTVDYYLQAGNVEGITITVPHGAPDTVYSFIVGSDLIAPTLRHGPLTDQTPATWPPALWAQASDNQAVAGVALAFSLDGGPIQGPFAFTETGGTWQLTFPLATGDVSVGDVISYTVTATDVATVPNTTTSGPHEVRVVDQLARVLLIDDSVFGQPTAEIAERLRDRPPVTSPPTRDTATMVQWLTAAGYEVGIAEPDEVTMASVQGWDVLYLYTANNSLPIGEPLLRSTLIAWADAGGSILVEGGAVGEVCLEWGQYVDFAEHVLHSAEWWGDSTGPLEAPAGYEDHFALIRPNLLPETITPDFSDNPYDWGASDAMLPDATALPILRSIYNAAIGGMIVHDRDTGPEAGETVYITFDTSNLEDMVARPLLENALAYLTSRQAPGGASIAGQVTLLGNDDASGVEVTCAGQSVTTGPDGQFLFLGLHGSTYTLTATRAGYGPVSVEVTVGAEEAIEGIAITLLPVIEIHASATPAVGIPDNDPEGIVSTLEITEVGVVNGIDVDIDIAHPSIGNLTVELTSPSGTTVVLHDRTGAIADDIVGNWPQSLIVDGPGSLADFLGESVLGTWTLAVADHQFGGIGTFNSWGLNILATPDDVLAAPGDLPTALRLVGAVPNPFNPQTELVFELPRAGQVQLDVYDLRGRHVRRLVDGLVLAGRHAVRWDGRDDGGRALASGVYLCRLRTDQGEQRRKLTLAR
jgi:subtilisin-like proprotein convertase family protein